MHPLQKYRSAQILLGSIASSVVFLPIAAQAVTFNFTGSIDTFNVTTTGVYSITALGASGGKAGDNLGVILGGNGGETRGDFNLTAGDILSILVGGAGADGTLGAGGGGGGGGTFVVLNSRPLTIAGGGRGATYFGSFGLSAAGGGGGGFSGNGSIGIAGDGSDNGFNGSGPGGNGGTSFLGGGRGGLGGDFRGGFSGGNGGFGGGGGGGFGSRNGGGGGGGGFSGGQGRSGTIGTGGRGGSGLNDSDFGSGGNGDNFGSLFVSVRFGNGGTGTYDTTRLATIANLVTNDAVNVGNGKVTIDLVPTAVPEPLTIIGTIIGGTAAMQMRKKLKSTIND